MIPEKNKSLIKLVIFVFLLVLLWFLSAKFNIDFKFLEDYLKGRPLIFSGTVFILAYIFSSLVFWFSKDILKLIGALLFGAVSSTIFIWIAEIINCAILFHLARYLGRDFVEKKLKLGKNFDQKLAGINFIWLFLFRSVPLIPFRILDLGMGLTKISFRRYLVAVIIGSPLRIFWIQYVLVGVGKAIFSNPLAASDYLTQNPLLFLLTFTYFLLVIIVALRLKGKNKCL